MSEGLCLTRQDLKMMCSEHLFSFSETAWDKVPSLTLNDENIDLIVQDSPPKT